jgi:hypothetical protein
MSNSDILGRADKVLRPVITELGRFSWIRIEGCCAGHKPEDTLWLETRVLGMTGLARLTDMLRVLGTKLSGTDIRVDCLLSYSSEADFGPAPHGWIPLGVEVFWPPRQDWRRSQSMVVETLLSTIADCASRLTESARSDCAINYCPFCSSSFVRIESIGAAQNRYRCGDCDVTWTMVDPAV